MAEPLSVETVYQWLAEHAEQPGGGEEVAKLTARVLQSVIGVEGAQQHFTLWEEAGLHLTPVHFYSPIPDTSALQAVAWDQPSDMVGVDMNDTGHQHLLTEIFPQFADEVAAIPRTLGPQDPDYTFYLDNGLFSGTDAMVLYALLRHLQPRRVIEVGSGHSSRLTAQAGLKNGGMRLTCIEPYPSPSLQRGFPGLESLLRQRVQDIEFSVFQQLSAGDVLFIDSSHVVKTGSDVNYLFLEVLPRLGVGVYVHIHDIFLPFPGRRDWALQEHRFWNEQDLLHAFLLMNDDFQVVFGNTYAKHKFPELLQAAFPTSPWWGGGSFWIKRVR